jgi:hypothetical protein
MRFSLRWLFVLILLAAIAITALLNANEYVAWFLWSALVLVLSMAIVAAIASDTRTRAFWSGFAVLGWVYFASTGFTLVDGFGGISDAVVIPWLHAQIADEGFFDVQPMYDDMGRLFGSQTNREKIPTLETFRATSRGCVTLLMAILGGYVALWFYSRRDQR